MPDPIYIPDRIKLVQSSFECVKRADVVRSRGRYIAADIQPFSYWMADYQVAPMNAEDFGFYNSFMMDIIGGGVRFLGFDLKRPRPVAYSKGVLSGVKASGGAFVGEGVLDAVNNNKSVVVSGLPSGFVLSVGDMVEFRVSALRRSLHRIRADAVANSQGVVTIEFNYGLDMGNFPEGSIVNFEKPACVMERFSPASASSGATISQGSFSGQEVFL